MKALLIDDDSDHSMNSMPMRIFKHTQRKPSRYMELKSYENSLFNCIITHVFLFTKLVDYPVPTNLTARHAYGDELTGSARLREPADRLGTLFSSSVCLSCQAIRRLLRQHSGVLSVLLVVGWDDNPRQYASSTVVVRTHRAGRHEEPIDGGWPWPVRNLFSGDHSRRGRSEPGTHVVASTMRNWFLASEFVHSSC